jgi:hypothetical protein
MAQRRNLAHQVPRPHDAARAVAAARDAFRDATRRAEPFTRPLREAEAEVERTTAAMRQMRAAMAQTPRWRRLGLAARLREAEDGLADARADRDAAWRAAGPHTARVDRAELELRRLSTPRA